MAGTFLHRTIGLMAAAGIGLCPCRGRPPLRGRTALSPPASMTPSRRCRRPLRRSPAASRSPSWRSAAPQRSGGRQAAPISPGQRASPALTSRFPAARVTVDNRAVARQTAQEMAAWIAR